MVSTSDHAIGGDCLNDGCVPSKAFIHVAKLAHGARLATRFGMEVSGKVNMQQALDYVRSRQSLIRAHENAACCRSKAPM